MPQKNGPFSPIVTPPLDAAAVVTPPLDAAVPPGPETVGPQATHAAAAKSQPNRRRGMSCPPRSRRHHGSCQAPEAAMRRCARHDGDVRVSRSLARTPRKNIDVTSFRTARVTVAVLKAVAAMAR
jgi:hypothetical protein